MTMEKPDAVPYEDIGAFMLAFTCLVLIGFKRDTATVTSVLTTIIGFMFGKYRTKKK